MCEIRREREINQGNRIKKKYVKKKTLRKERKKITKEKEASEINECTKKQERQNE